MYIFNIFCLYSYLNLKITLETYGKKKLILESKEMMKKKITHCKNSDYKYKIFYAVGQNYTYQKQRYIGNTYDAVSLYLF